MTNGIERSSRKALRAVAPLIAACVLGAPGPRAAAATPSVTSGSEPAARSGHRAFWTGSAMIVWGGTSRGDDGSEVYPGPYQLDVAQGRWTRLPDPSPELRGPVPAAWTGSELLTWGSGECLTPGGRLDPSTGSWRKLPPLPKSCSYISDAIVWTGRELIAWGGDPLDERVVPPGARFDPVAGSWTLLPTKGAPAGRRTGHTAVWTGTELIVWGGALSHTAIANGGRYDPAHDVWRPMSSAGQEARTEHTATWTGREMLVWGGTRAGAPVAGGARYDPGADRWTPISATGAPGAALHAAAWSGTELLVWTSAGEGGRYDPATDTWRPISGKGAPTPRAGFSAIWTGRELVVWGGLRDARVPSDNGGAYDPATDSWRPLGVDWIRQRARSHERALATAVPFPAGEGESCVAHGFARDGRFAYTCTWVENHDYSEGPVTETWIVGAEGEERTDLGRLEESGIRLGGLELHGGPGPWAAGGLRLAFVPVARMLLDDDGELRWATDGWVTSPRGRRRLISAAHYWDSPTLRPLALARNPEDGRLAVVAMAGRRSIELSYDRVPAAGVFAPSELARERATDRKFVALADPNGTGPFETTYGGRVEGVLGFSRKGRFAFIQLRGSGSDEPWLVIADLVSDTVVHAARWDGKPDLLLQHGIVPLDPLDLRGSGPKLEHSGYSYVGEVRGSDLVVVRSSGGGEAWKRVAAAPAPETAVMGWFVSPWEARAAAVVTDGRRLQVVGVHLANGFEPVTGTTKGSRRTPR